MNLLLLLLGCPTGPGTPPLPTTFDGLEPDVQIDGERLRQVPLGETATYDVRFVWPTDDGEPPLYAFAEPPELVVPQVDPDCGLSAGWVEDNHHAQVQFTPTRPGMACQVWLDLRYQNRHTSGRVLSPQIYAQGVEARVEQLELPVDEARLVPGEVRPWVAFAYGPVAPAGSLATGERRYPSAAPQQWASSDPSVVEVDEAGRLTGVAPGEATVTVEVGGLEASASVVVEPGEPGPPGFGVRPLLDQAVFDLMERRPDPVREDVYDVATPDGGPAHLLPLDTGISDPIGGVRWLLVSWTGSGFGYEILGGDLAEQPLGGTFGSLLSPTLWIDDDGTTYVLGLDSVEQRVTLYDRSNVADPWRRRVLDSGYEGPDGAVPWFDSGVQYGTTEQSPMHTRARLKLGPKADLRRIDGELYATWATYTDQQWVDDEEVAHDCAATLRLAEVPATGPLDAALVAQTWGQVAPLGSVTAPDCDRLPIAFSRVELLPEDGGVPRLGVTVDRVFGAGQVEDRYDLVLDAGNAWTRVDEVDALPIAEIPAGDDGVSLDRRSYGPDDDRYDGLAARPGASFQQWYWADRPEEPPFEVAGPVRSTHLAEGHHWFVGNDIDVDIGFEGLLAVRAPVWRIPDPAGGPVQLVGGVGTQTTVPRTEAGTIVWFQGEPVQAGFYTPTAGVVRGDDDFQNGWEGDDGPRYWSSLSTGAALGRPGLPDEVLDVGRPVMGQASSDGDYWGFDDIELWVLPADDLVATVIPFPPGVDATNLRRVLARPDGAVLITRAFDDSTYHWIDSTGVVEQTVTSIDDDRWGAPELAVLSDDWLHLLEGVDTLQLAVSADGATWDTHPLPGDRTGTTGRSHLITEHDGELALIGPERIPHFGEEVHLRTSSDGGVTWSPPTRLHPQGPSKQRVCAAALAPDGSEIAMLLDTNDLAGAAEPVGPLLDVSFYGFWFGNCSTLVRTPIPPVP